jgi:hypothetical protein
VETVTVVERSICDIHRPLCEIEADLVGALRTLRCRFAEYDELLSKRGEQIVPGLVRRSIPPIRKVIECRIRRWGWEKYLGSDGEVRAKESFDAHFQQKRVPLLNAARSRAEMPRGRLHEDIEKLAREAEALGIKASLEPGACNRPALVALHDDWKNSSALGAKAPKIELRHRRFLERAYAYYKEQIGEAVARAEILPACRVQTGTEDNETPGAIPDLVTLDQAAAAVRKSKRTLERYKTTGAFPLPAVEGGGGRADLWDWKVIRPWLENEFHIKLPETFPANRKI